MKKKYMAPAIVIERYELTQSIAGCSTKIGFLNSACVEKDPDATPDMKDLAGIGFFTDSGNGKGCLYFPVGMDANDGICYHTNANAAFSS